MLKYLNEKVMRIVISIQFAIFKNGKLIAFGLTQEMLMEQFTKIKSKLNAGIYKISKVIDFLGGQEVIETEKYITLS